MQLFFIALIILSIFDRTIENARYCLTKEPINHESILSKNISLQIQELCAEQPNKSAQAWLFFAHGYPGPINLTRDEAQENLLSQSFFLPPSINFYSYAPGLCFLRNITNLGQGNDIAQIEKHLRAFIEHKKNHAPDKPLIVMGHSNGASSLIVTLCKHPELANNIAHIILLAPYANILDNRYKSIFKKKKEMVSAIQKTIAPGYSPDEKNPIEWISSCLLPNQNIPITLIHAQDDSFINISHSKLIKKTLRSAKYANVSLFTIPNGDHQFNTECGPLDIIHDKIMRFL
ncbi:hypothetical protein FJ366_00675 [Candidatus Dependentiae bacterium]|nr:hypothetical protein [Candidatus Dependentiae bacterium]